MPFSVFRKKRAPKLTREQSLAAKPFRNPAVKWTNAETGDAVLEFPVRPTRRLKLAAWVIGKKTDEMITRKLELDEVGTFVWEACDGRASVGDIIGRVRKAYKLSRKESEHSTTLFLKMLAQKGVLVMDVSEAMKGEGS